MKLSLSITDFSKHLTSLLTSKRHKLCDIKKGVDILADVEKDNTENQNIQFVRESADIGLKVAEPYKKIIGWLVAGFVSLLIITNIVWGGVYLYTVYKAYQEPTTYEQQQTQEFKENQQEQSNKGSAS